MASSLDNVELLFTCKIDELNCVTGYTDCEVSVFFLLRMFHSIDKLLCTKYVYVEVVSTLCKVTVKCIYEVINSLFSVVSESIRVDCLSI